MTPRLSVIVPIYQVEEYVGQAVRSVLDSTFSDLELILVDDGSPDNSLAVALEAAAGDPRVRSFQQENKGSGGARNNGLAHAVGEYVTYLDSDDLVEPDHYRLSIAELDASGSDFCVCPHRILNPDGSISEADRRIFATELVGITLESLPAIVHATAAWNKVFRRQFLLDIGFEFVERVLSQDQLPAAQAFGGAIRFDVLTHDCVQYRRRADGSSVMQGRFKPKFTADLLQVLSKSWQVMQAVATPAQAQAWLQVAVGRIPFPEEGPVSDAQLERLEELSAEFWPKLTAPTRLALTLQRRCAMYWAANRQREPLRALLEAGGMDPANWSVRPIAGRSYGTFPAVPAVAELPEWLLRARGWDFGTALLSDPATLIAGESIHLDAGSRTGRQVVQVTLNPVKVSAVRLVVVWELATGSGGEITADAIDRLKDASIVWDDGYGGFVRTQRVLHQTKDWIVNLPEDVVLTGIRITTENLPANASVVIQEVRFG
jgi:CDP-glycerol glycerophosphotransferase